jgi:lipopolysaccharide biosynthesis glycosyltransferase
MTKCIFICVFNQEKYIELFYLLVKSIRLYGNLIDTDILVYTSTLFMNKIKQSFLYNDQMKFVLNDSYNTIDKACKARLDLFQFKSISKYDKILYLDTDIIIKNDINKLFDIVDEDILYVLEEGTIDDTRDYWGENIIWKRTR